MVLVVRHGKSSKHVVRRARDLLLRSGAPITGIVLNAVDLSSPEYYGYYGYSGYSYSSVDSESWEPQAVLDEQQWRGWERLSEMRQRQDLLWVHERQSGLQGDRGLGSLAAASLLLFCMMSGSAEAQFSGPALGASSPVNVPVVPTTDPAILYPTGRDIHLAQGDLLSVHLYGAPDYAPPVRVSLDGTIQLPLIGVCRVEDLTTHQAENLIAERLKGAGCIAIRR